MASPKRPLPLPPPRRPTSGVQETPTKPKGATLAIYQGLLSVFDDMTDQQRIEFVELAFVYGQLSDEDRRALIDLANYLKNP